MYRKFRAALQPICAQLSEKLLTVTDPTCLRFGAESNRPTGRNFRFALQPSPDEPAIGRLARGDRRHRTCAAPTRGGVSNDRRASHVKPEANAGIARRSRTDDQCLFQRRYRPAALPRASPRAPRRRAPRRRAPPRRRPRQPVTIDWWHIATGDPGKADFQAIADAYTAAHPNVKINITVTRERGVQDEARGHAGRRLSGPVPVVGRRDHGRPGRRRPAPGHHRRGGSLEGHGQRRGDEHLPVQGRPVRDPVGHGDDRLLVQQGTLPEGGHHGPAGDLGRVPRRHPEAEGSRRGPARHRGQGQVAVDAPVDLPGPPQRWW